MSPLDLVPSPGAALDWGALAARFSWARALESCPQDAEWHAEGDVGVHTRMVLAWLLESDAWRRLDERDRAITFWACLLHDVAKPLCTREVDGRLTSRGHSEKGADLARRVLWELGMPFAEREEVVGLVRHHQVPFFAIERDDAERRVIAASQRCRPALLALVAEADARGRIAADLARLVDNTALFRELARDLGCLDEAYRFSSEHARLLYLRGERPTPGSPAHFEPRCEVLLLSGLPAAGKNTWLEAHAPELPVVSLDELRAELGVAPDEPQGRVVDAARARAREHLRAGRSFAWNATSLSRDLRQRAISLFVDYGARVRVIYLEEPRDVLEERNQARKARVPKKVLEKMISRWTVPDVSEAHDVDYWISGERVTLRA